MTRTDPFSEALVYAQTGLSRAQLLLRQYEDDPVQTRLADLNNTIQDLTETIHELSQSIALVQANPEEYGLDAVEIGKRIEQVGQINKQLNDIQQTLVHARNTRPTGEWTDHVPGLDPSLPGQDSNGNDEVRQLMYQEAMREQDTVLDSVHTTVNTLREQANVMSRELEDQAFLLDDFSHEADRAGDRLHRGMKRVEWVLANNRETLSSCFITLLIIVLIILLVLVIIA